MKKIKEIFKSDAAFTILEVITAIFILTIGVGASFSLMNQTLSAASIVEQKAIASYLAQEGIEIVKNIRDSTWLEKRTSPSLNWDVYLGALDVGGYWEAEADYNSQTLTDYSGTPLYIQTNDFYGYDVSDVQTKFIRKITIDKLEADKIKVSVEVKWEERNRPHSFTVLEYITNWYEQLKQNGIL
ncbi:MAG: type IV pilus modification PilV family protein [Candidatus Nealsonbacteria bacterium]